MGSMRMKFGKEFKAKVAFEALKGLKTTAELASEFGVHTTQINQWKKELKEGLPTVFEGKKTAEEKQQERIVDDLYKRIGQLEMDNNWLKKKLHL
jgi:transposase-like protein